MVWPRKDGAFLVTIDEASLCLMLDVDTSSRAADVAVDMSLLRLTRAPPLDENCFDYRSLE